MKIVCLGDSLTEGYEIKQASRWTDLIKNELKIDIVNAGISGDTTAGMLSRCEQLLLKEKPTHVIILGGTNDLWFGLNDELILANIHAISRMCRFYKAEAIIGIITPSVNLTELNIIGENYSECIRTFRTSLINYCKLENGLYIDFSEQITSDHMLADGVHPNSSGHELMKKNVLNFLNKAQLY
ncbi:MAG: hypothetical protein HKN54_02815 [Flavobacteriaceae bacterium]|nr:hypothetical protein [Flavobacteriaceae bacterium]